MQAYNEPIAAVIIGLLLSVSAGFRIMLPLLGVNLLAYFHQITLPENLAWLSTGPTLIVLSVATVVETIVHFIPAAGTYLKGMATPLAFVAGTLLMAVPLGDHNPIYQWTLAAVVGGGVATLTHLGVTSARVLTAPANAASMGLFGIVWNICEFLFSIFLAAVGAICIFAGWAIGAVVLLSLIALAVYLMVKGFNNWSARSRPVAT